jgi:thiamine biosynthesis lipoprotein
MGGMQEYSRAFRAMGSDCVVRVVVANDRAEPILDRVVEKMAELEQRWSRFIVESELSQLNDHAGAPVFVSPETFAILSLAVDAWRATGGRFDPTMLDALRNSGYDETFNDLATRAPVVVVEPTSMPGGLNGVELDSRAFLIQTPPGLHFDLGGIGKGYAADCLFTQVMEDGVSGACLDFGGDVRVGGATAEGGGWTIVIDDPFHPGDDLAVLGLGDGSVTTSSRLRRKWPTTSGEAHHLLDPATSRPSESGLASVTVIAAHAAWGEVHAKAALIAGATEGAALIENAGLSALLVTDDGDALPVGQFEAFLIEGPTLEK